MQLSDHFTLAEMTFSQTAARRGIDNSPSPAIIAALRQTCVHLLEPIRAHFGRPVMVTSGYRSPALNRAIGGVPESQHCQGEATDIVIQGVDNPRIARWIMHHLSFDQLIMEGHWVHVAYRADRARQSVLTAHFVHGHAHYTDGLAA